MRNPTQAVLKVIKSAVIAFERYPAVIINAAAFTIVTLVRIQLDWPVYEPYDFVLNCLMLSFALGAILGLAAIAHAQSKYDNRKAFMTANFISIIAAIATFIILYFTSGVESPYITSGYKKISEIADTRAAVIMIVSYLYFIVLGGKTTEESNFSKSFFMSHKAFFIALIYGLAVMGGGSGVAGAVQALLYRGMSSKVYSYIGTLSGFFAFTVFVGYFPDFRKDAEDSHWETAQRQPRFIEILLGYIMTLIMSALTVVLILWAGKTILEGMEAPFVRLSSIASAFAIGGIWLHILVTDNETGPSRFYRRTYPFAVIFILIFEAWALVAQLMKFGLKTEEYNFSLIWIGALCSAVFLIIKKDKAHHLIVAIISILIIISVLPSVGYYALPVKNQTKRLEKLLTAEGILQNGELKPAATEPDRDTRRAITEAVVYLAYVDNAKLPLWFDNNIRDNDKFKDALGFDQVYNDSDYYDYKKVKNVYFYLKNDAVDISEYQWGADMERSYKREGEYVEIQGERGLYKIIWEADRSGDSNIIKILLNENELVRSDFSELKENLMSKYPPVDSRDVYAPAEDMSIVLEGEGFKVLVVFDYITLYAYSEKEEYTFYFKPHIFYFKEY